jgi:hypothetical protein
MNGGELTYAIDGRRLPIMPTTFVTANARIVLIDTRLEFGLIGRDRFLVPFQPNAGHVGNVKQAVFDLI